LRDGPLGQRRQIPRIPAQVSKQVKLLERWLGQTLFILEGRRLVLTPFGDLLSRKLGIAFQRK